MSPRCCTTTAVAGVNDQGVPTVTVKLEPQVITGGNVSTSLTCCEHVALLPQQSTACQMRIWMRLHNGPVLTVLITVTVTFVPQHASEAVGGSKVHVLPHCTVLFDAQISTGGVMSATKTVATQVDVFVQQSVAFHVLVT